MISDKLKIKLLKYWLERPTRIREIPDHLKSKIKDVDVTEFIDQMGYYPSTGDKNAKRLTDYKRELEKDVADAEASLRHKEIAGFMKKQTSVMWILALGTFILAFEAFLTIFSISLNSGDNSLMIAVLGFILLVAFITLIVQLFNYSKK